MNPLDFKKLYSKDSEGHRVYHGPTKVWMNGRMWYPHLLMRVLLHAPQAPKGYFYKQTCGVEDCITPEHYECIPKQTPLEQTR